MTNDSEAAAAVASKKTGKAERSAAASILATRRHSMTAPRTRRRQCSKAARALWDGMTAEERSAEMRRRRRLGIIRKKKALRGITDDD